MENTGIGDLREFGMWEETISFNVCALPQVERGQDQPCLNGAFNLAE
jgi:hypothetical protein